MVLTCDEQPRNVAVPTTTPPPPDWLLDRRRAVGDRIRAVRTEAGITQETLAERSGLDRKTIVRTEGGTHSTLLDHLLLIARALGRPLSDLVR